MSNLKIGVIGASGRMGRVLVEKVFESDELDLAAAVESPSSPLLGQPVGSSSPVVLTSSLHEAAVLCDVLIDFSSPNAMEHVLDAAQSVKKPLVCGITGLDPTAKEMLQKASELVPIFYSANMSLGIAVLTQAVALVASSLGEEFDIEIQDIHHAKKKDAPSGTALLLGNTAAKARHWPTPDVFCFDRSAIRQERPHQQIGFSVLRGGGVSGQHSVFFLGPQESLTLSHESYSRAVFADGALKAASWISKQKPGLYGMKDLVSVN